MLTLYFNRCFSAYSFMISELQSSWKQGQLKVIISHSNHDPYLLKVADHFLIEPPLEGEAYLEFILETCQTYKVDVFFPRKHVTWLSQHQSQFLALGVQVAFVCSAEHYKLFDHKFNASQELAKKDLVYVPEIALVNNYSQFDEHYKRIRATRLDGSKGHESVCLKPNIGIGGKGFMRIAHHRTEQDDLFRDSLHSIAFARLERNLKVLADESTFPELLLSTYLKEEELSIDCIAYNGKLLAAYPRFYINKHEQRFVDQPELIEACKQICAYYRLNYLFNVQFKKHRGKWYFIELNTRSAAGAHRICTLHISPLTVSLKLILEQKVTEDLSIEWGQVIQRSEVFRLR